MKHKTYTPPPLNLYEGFISDKEYNSYQGMSESINNWQQLCPYQLGPDGLSGRHQILQLQRMQIVYAKRNGGTMHNAGSAKDSMTIAVVEACADKACFGQLKLQKGDILFFDDSYPHNFVTNDSIQFIAVSIHKNNLDAKTMKLLQALNQCIKDIDSRFARTLGIIWDNFTQNTQKKKDTEDYKRAEEEILTVLMELLSRQIPTKPKLTSGEKTALIIRDQVFQHMDGNISIHSLAKQHNISEQTLQNSFKSLFGFTPKLFLRLLKLNLVHQELQNAHIKQDTVSKVAIKWGFTHMGRFSAYYTELFGENPSQALQKNYIHDKGLKASCVSRKEEML